MAGTAQAQTQTGYRATPRIDIGGGRMTGDMWCQYGTNGVRFKIGTQAVTQVGTVGVINGTNATGLPSLDFTYASGSISANFNGFNAVYIAGSEISKFGQTIELGTETTGNTNNISEGSTNQYYADARVNAAVGSLSVNVFSDTNINLSNENDFVKIVGGQLVAGSSSSTVAFSDVTGSATSNTNFAPILAQTGKVLVGIPDVLIVNATTITRSSSGNGNFDKYTHVYPIIGYDPGDNIGSTTASSGTSTGGGLIDFAGARDGSVGAAGKSYNVSPYATTKNTWTIEYTFPSSVKIGKLRWYSFASSERNKNFLVESMQGTWTKVPITGWEDGATQYNTDEAQASDGNGWKTVTFTGTTSTQFRLRMTSAWNNSDSGCAVTELEMYENVPFTYNRYQDITLSPTAGTTTQIITIDSSGTSTIHPSYGLYNLTTMGFGYGSTTSMSSVGPSGVYSTESLFAELATNFIVKSKDTKGRNFQNVTISALDKIGNAKIVSWNPVNNKDISRLDAETVAKESYIKQNKKNWESIHKNEYVTAVIATGTGTINIIDIIAMEKGYKDYIELEWASLPSQSGWIDKVEDNAESDLTIRNYGIRLDDPSTPDELRKPGGVGLMDWSALNSKAIQELKAILGSATAEIEKLKAIVSP